MKISDSEMDAAILAVVDPTWRKVAMIVSRATRHIGDFAMTDEGYHIAAARLEVLVRSGRLVAQGDVSKWRHSEIRLPSSDAAVSATSHLTKQ